MKLSNSAVSDKVPEDLKNAFIEFPYLYRQRKVSMDDDVEVTQVTAKTFSPTQSTFRRGLNSSSSNTEIVAEKPRKEYVWDPDQKKWIEQGRA